MVSGKEKGTGKREKEEIQTTSNENLFSQSFDLTFLEKKMSLQPASFQRLLGTASSAAVMADKQRHARQRRQQAKAFSPAALASYAPRVAAATETAVAKWASECEGGGENDDGSLDLSAALSDLTWAYALATVVDVSLDAEESRSVRAAWDDFTKNLFSAPLDFPGSRFRTALRARETLKTALGRAVREYETEFKNGMDSPPTMMSIYMRARADDGDPLGEEELTDMAIGLLLAG